MEQTQDGVFYAGRTLTCVSIFHRSLAREIKNLQAAFLTHTQQEEESFHKIQMLQLFFTFFVFHPFFGATRKVETLLLQQSSSSSSKRGMLNTYVATVGGMCEAQPPPPTLPLLPLPLPTARSKFRELKHTHPSTTTADKSIPVVQYYCCNIAS